MGPNKGNGSKTARNGLPQMKGLKELSCWFSNEIVRYRYGRDDTPEKIVFTPSVCVHHEKTAIPAIFLTTKSLQTCCSQGNGDSFLFVEFK